MVPLVVPDLRLRKRKAVLYFENETKYRTDLFDQRAFN